MSPWWTGLAPAQTTVKCGGATHTLRWEAGQLTALDHDDIEAEATLAALAGQPARCLDVLSAWRRRRDDPRVLTLGSRGRSDPLDITADPRRLRRPAAPKRTRAGETELIELLDLGGGLADRLQAHTAATWTRRLHTGHSALPAAMPQLHAALYGRALNAIRLWLGQPRLEIDLELIGPTDLRRLRLADDRINVALPFAWLSDTWARDLTTIFGQFCLNAETPDGINWTLHTIGTDLGAAQISVTLDKAGESSP